MSVHPSTTLCDVQYNIKFERINLDGIDFLFLIMFEYNILKVNFEKLFYFSNKINCL